MGEASWSKGKSTWSACCQGSKRHVHDLHTGKWVKARERQQALRHKRDDNISGFPSRSEAAPEAGPSTTTTSTTKTRTTKTSTTTTTTTPGRPRGECGGACHEEGQYGAIATIAAAVRGRVAQRSRRWRGGAPGGGGRLPDRPAHPAILSELLCILGAEGCVVRAASEPAGGK